MSLTNPIPRGTRVSPPYMADGINAAYNVPFWFLSPLDLEIAILLGGATQTLSGGVGYSATGMGLPSGGSVQLASVPVVGSIVTIIGHRIPNRTTSVMNGGVVSGAALDLELDTVEASMQELRRDADQCLATANSPLAYNASGPLADLSNYSGATLPFTFLQPDDAQGRLTYWILQPGATGAGPREGTGPQGAAGTNGADASPSVQGQTTVNFGAFPGADTASVAVADAGVLSTSSVLAELLLAATSDHSADEHFVEEMDVYAGAITSGVGFTIFARARNAPLYGAWNLQWVRR